MLVISEQAETKGNKMSQTKAELIADLQNQIEEAHRQADLAREAGEENHEYQWRQEATALVGQLEIERIDRPFTAYEEMYGDYPF